MKTGWKPVARGHIFCAPLCGRGCTKGKHDAAVVRGRALAKQLGRGWRGFVWENLGWHSKAVHVRASVEVYKHGDARYWATTRGHTMQFEATGKTPAAAVRAMMARLGAAAKLHSDMLAEIGPAFL